MTLTPVNIPVDTSKLRIEKTAIRRVPGEAFHALHNLEYLWMPYNSLASLSGITFKGLRRLQELRLDGNDLISFPWETLADMPQLRLLDLHNNELTSIPPDAARYVKNITYLDLSSNKLMTLPQALIATWANLQAVPYFPNDNSKIILVHQEISSDGMSWSILGLPVVSYLDSGEYICKAKNFLGATEAFISLIITDSESTDDPNSNAKGAWSGKASGMEAAAYNDKLVARYVITTSTVPTLGAGVGTGEGLLLPDVAQDSNPRNLLVSPPTGQQEPERIVRSVRVIGDTDQSITLAWKAPLAKNTTVFSVLYAIFGERDMRRINVEPGKTKVTIYGLLPKTKYIVCVCVKGLIPRKEQCIIFSTDEVASAGGTQKLINVVVISVACVIAVPLTLVVCCGALKRRCKKCFVRKPKEIQESYVTFESLSPGAKAKGVEGEYLTRHTPDESNRLLSARSSVDSEAIPKIEGQPNEYFC
ncbi:leucine-rich repeat, immunoglobulin-like domain and transmembrane domain-containing protein 1 [Grus japonensis]